MWGNTPTAVVQARAVTSAAFAKGTVPAPYYLYVLARYNALCQAASKAVQSGCANNRPAGLQYVRSFGSTAQYPKATRRMQTTRLVPRKVLVRNGVQLHPYVQVTVTAQQPIL